MTLWRVDADFECGDTLDADVPISDAYEVPATGGELMACASFFAATLMQKQMLLAWLSGWDLDVYQEPCDGFSEQQINALIGRPWPMRPLADLVAMATRPKRAAAERLAEIQGRTEAAKAG